MSDHEGLSIFDSGTAAGTFTVVLRGYDRNEVNSYLGRFEAARREADTELERLRSQVDDLSERASTAEQRLQEVGQPTYAGLGGRVSELLRLAETQAARVRDQQQALADNTERQRAALEATLAAHRQTVEASKKAHRALVDRETAALAAKLAKDRESATAGIAVQYQTAEAKIAELTKAVQERAAAADAAAAAAHKRAEDAILATEANTKAALEHARKAAEEITADAEAEAEGRKSDAVAAAKAETDKLERRIQALRTERDAMVAHLASLKKIIGDIGE